MKKKKIIFLLEAGDGGGVGAPLAVSRGAPHFARPCGTLCAPVSSSSRSAPPTRSDLVLAKRERERERDSADTHTHTQTHTHLLRVTHTKLFFFQPCCVSTNGTSLNLQDISRLFPRLHVNISTRTEVSGDIKTCCQFLEGVETKTRGGRRGFFSLSGGKKSKAGRRRRRGMSDSSSSSVVARSLCRLSGVTERTKKLQLNWCFQKKLVSAVGARKTQRHGVRAAQRLLHPPRDVAITPL